MSKKDKINELELLLNQQITARKVERSELEERLGLSYEEIKKVKELLSKENDLSIGYLRDRKTFEQQRDEALQHGVKVSFQNQELIDDKKRLLGQIEALQKGYCNRQDENKQLGKTVFRLERVIKNNKELFAMKDVDVDELNNTIDEREERIGEALGMIKLYGNMFSAKTLVNAIKIALSPKKKDTVKIKHDPEAVSELQKERNELKDFNVKDDDEIVIDLRTPNLHNELKDFSIEIKQQKEKYISVDATPETVIFEKNASGILSMFVKRGGPSNE